MKELDIFLKAPPEASPVEIGEYLASACGDDLELRKRVEVMFEQDRAENGLMDRAPLGSVDPNTIPDEEVEGTMIGNYKLLHEIGKGGFGVVYMAEQLRPVKRRVALKIIKLGMDTRQVVARFEAERQALAMMDHPNIAKVHDAGATENGRPFFVMELVRGVPITQYCDDNKLSTEKRLKLFADVCRAVQHAHQKGVIHRDLKPSNVMVTMHDDKAVPKVIDFGVAKATQTELTDKTLYTRYEHFIGTPAYMSPEQAQMSGLDIDTRSDIYALGVLLYELLTGTTPFDAKELARAGQDEVRRVIREDEPPKPSTRVNTLGNAALTDLASRHQEALPKLSSTLRGDLDWIVMKALEKDRTRRYETANSFAEDIRRYLTDEPVIAAAPSLGYRFRKYAKRHRTGLTVTAGVAALLIVATGVSTWMAIKATHAQDKAARLAATAISAQEETEKAREEAVDARDEAAKGELQAKLQFAEELLGTSEPRRGVALLAQILRNDPGNRVAAGRLLSALTQRGWPHQRGASMRAREAPLLSADLSATGDEVVLADWSGRIQVFNAETGAPRNSPTMDMETPVQQRVLSISPDGKSMVCSTRQILAVWDRRTCTRKFFHRSKAREPFAFAEWSPDSRWILTGGSGKNAMVLDAENGESLGDGDSAALLPHDGFVMSGQFGPDGRLAVTGSLDSKARLWSIDVSTASIKLLATLEHEGRLWCVKLSGDGRRLVTASGDGVAQVWSLPDFEAEPDARPQKLGTPLVHKARVFYAEFSPDSKGERVVTASFDGTARVWDSETGSPISEPMQHASRILRARFNKDGSRIVTGSTDGTARVWDVGSGQEIGEPIRHHGTLIEVRFGGKAPGGEEWILTAGKEGIAKVWEARQRQPRSMILRHHYHSGWTEGGGELLSARFNGDGSLLLSGAQDGAARIWNIHTGQTIARLNHPGDIGQVDLSKDGKRALTVSGVGTKTVQVWTLSEQSDADGGLTHISAQSTQIPAGPTSRASFSPDPAGARLLTAQEEDKSIRVWESSTGRLLRELPHKRELWAAAFLPPDGRYVVTGGFDGGVRVWDLESTSSTPHLELGFHSDSIEALAVSADGRYVATAGWDNTARIWDTSELSDTSPDRDREVAKLDHSARLFSVVFSPDSYAPLLLATGAGDGSGQLWAVETAKKTAKKIGAAMIHANKIVSIRFSPDGRRVATASHDHTSRIWDVPSGLPLSEPLRHDDACLHAEFSPDGNKVVTTGADATARVWDVPPAQVPVPDWVADWAEAVVGIQLDESGTAKDVQWGNRNDIRQRIRSAPEDNYRRWADWFYQKQAIRPLSPFTDFSVRDFVGARIREAMQTSLQEAALVSPHYSRELGSMAKRLRDYESRRMPLTETHKKQRLEILDELIALSVKVTGSESIATLSLRRDRAVQLRNLERKEEALGEFSGILALSRKVRGEKHPETLKLLGALAAAHGHFMNFEARLKFEKQRVDLLSQEFEAEDFETLQARGNLAQALWALGKRGEALSLQRELAMAWSKTAPGSQAERDAMRNLGWFAFVQEEIELAVETTTRTANHPEGDSIDWLRLAAIQLHTSDLSAYRDTCATMITRYKGNRLAFKLEQTAKTCCAVPWPADWEFGREVINLASQAFEKQSNGPWNALARGMAAYRKGLNYEEAIEFLKSAEADTADTNCQVLAHLYHAMTASKLDRRDEARLHLEKAKELHIPLSKGDPGTHWHDIIFAEVAMKEAKAMLEVRE